MKNHIWRPLFVVIALVCGILLFRSFYVPADFGSQERGYTFGFHRLGNEREWQEVPAKYRDSRYCSECHEDKATALSAGKHRGFPCENCHGPALDHPDKPEKLGIDRSRELCIRCHSKLVMPSSGRNAIPGVDPAQHNPGDECVSCHNPHKPNLEDM